ncbi:phage minor head protein [Burkholderia cenocepacia]|uniref:phage minor head protein n=1 Tax=Burkholderia cenocepacia TaxID=95486 RepID=UPI00209B9F6B|nr:phage minor head protein [Burkholderia cenocepacia]
MASLKQFIGQTMLAFMRSSRSHQDLAYSAQKIREFLAQSPKESERTTEYVTSHLRKIHNQELKKQPPNKAGTFTRARVAQSAQQMLDEKIVQSMSLIELNRKKSVETTVTRFIGWASSLPPELTIDHPRQIIEKIERGTRKVAKSPIEIAREEEELKRAGSQKKPKPYKIVTTYDTRYVTAPEGPEKKESRAMARIKSDRENISKAAIKALARYEAQRVAQDQGHKLAAGISESIAVANSAVAATWETHYTKNPRETHAKRDGIVYVYRDSPAIQTALVNGWIKASACEWLEDLPEVPGMEINCRCTFSYIYTISALYRKAPYLFTAKYEADKKARLTNLVGV